ncbi:AAA family ATPase [Georgenia sp. Z1344]|uniref:AAA family ATPase n=1 Tax=Georgenia sp. Z1344 TaxID=3416706 RepID=UPI003CF03D2E
MLRRLDLNKPWRSLEPGFWPDELPAGRRTIVYGHNGSGKSTFAELLLSLADSDDAKGVVWEDDQKRRTSISADGVNSKAPIAVFTRKWVEANLSEFLDGASAAAIVTLGKEAIDAKEEQNRLVEELGNLQNQAEQADEQQKLADDKLKALARDVQDRIVSELQEFDYKHFTKSRYSVTKVQDDLRKYTGEIPDSNAHAEALKRLGEQAQLPAPAIVAAPADVADQLVALNELLSETPTRVAIRELESNPAAQTWVEEGLALHEGLDHCFFCAGEISRDRRDQLALHFDESWLQIRSRSKTLLAAVAIENQALIDWQTTLPAPTNLASELRSVYEEAFERINAAVDERIKTLKSIERTLNEKIADPSATPDAPEWSMLSTTPSISGLVQAITQHNEQVRRHEQITAERTQTVLDHLVGSQSEPFRGLEQQAKDLATASSRAKAAVKLAEHQLADVRRKQFTNNEKADALTRDLARVYGKGHLRVAVTSDGKSYACRRGDEPGKHLSHGERTTLSLLYFLHKLEDEQVANSDRSQRIVVIDDPSSSLDREALFATHQLLFDTLDNFGQYVILTHDFNLLQLFIKSHKTAWFKSRSRVNAADADEIRFPKVSFLEMYAASVTGARQSRVGSLPYALLKNTSEYAYLFSTLMAGIADSANHERLFLLPNAARRLLEIFASYKAPHRTNFLQQLEVLVESQEDEPYRDVYHFCNRFSHGEGSESIDVLDARAVHGQIRRCLEFLRAVDSEHFDRMCTATGVAPESLP